MFKTQSDKAAPKSVCDEQKTLTEDITLDLVVRYQFSGECAGDEFVILW